MVIRVGLSLILYSQLRIADSKWLYLFNRWDSGYYYSIAASWYPHHLSPEWAFFPLYPALIRLVVSLGVHVAYAALIVAGVSGLISVIVFQKIAEHYFGQMQAATSTLLYFTLPPVFVFSAVSYSEPVFLLFSLLAWYLHLTGKDVLAGSAAAICSMARPYGLLIALPLTFDYFSRRQFRKLSFAALPLFCFLGWTYYSLQMTGSFATVSALGTFWTSYPRLVFQSIFDQFFRGNLSGSIGAIQAFLGLVQVNIVRVTMGIISIVLVAFLGYKVLKTDRSLGAYVIVSVVAVSYFGIFPSIGSFPRYLGFLFPIGLVFGMKRKWPVWAVLLVLIMLDYIAWWAFIHDGFY